MEIEIHLNNNKVVVRESDNLFDALTEFDAKEIESVAYTDGDITTFAKPVKDTIKVTGKYNNRTGEFV